MINAEAKPGDTVVYCPDQIGPAVNRLLRPDRQLHQLVYPSGGKPLLIDWVDYVDRIRATDPAAFAKRALTRAGNHTIWYVVTPGYHNFEVRCEAIGSALAQARPGARNGSSSTREVLRARQPVRIPTGLTVESPDPNSRPSRVGCKPSWSPRRE